MSNIYEFNDNQNEEENCCEACQVTDEYLEIALECETKEELRSVLRGLFDDAHLEGFKDALHHDIGAKIDFIENLEKEDENLQ